MVHRVARASDKRLEAVGTTHGMDTRDSHQPRALKLDAFLAIQCLGDKILAAVKSSVTFIKTRSTWLPPRLSLVAAIMVDGSVKWRGVSITYTAVRDADASAERATDQAPFSGGREGVNVSTSNKDD